MTSGIRAAIEEVYAAFGDALQPRSIEVAYCRDPTEYLALTQTPLRELTVEQLQGYASSAMTTVGGLCDFEFFFPRLLELITHKTTLSGDSLPADREIVFGKVLLAGWPEWRQDRRRAFTQYVDAVVASFAEIFWETEDVDSWICSLSFCLTNLAPEMDILLSDTPAATANLISFYQTNSDTLLRGRLSNAFWNKDQPTYMQVLKWLQSQRVQDRIQLAYGLT